ncbi:hypothetical protein AB1Y20_021618 [Prymnesium parvum]
MLLAEGNDSSQDERAEVLISMLHIAENEIKAKDAQIDILNQMIAANERELSSKDGKIDELQQEIVRLKKEMDSFKTLFNRYLAKSEAARGSRQSSSPSLKGAAGAASNAPPGLPPPPTVVGTGVPSDGSAFVSASPAESTDSSSAVRPEKVSYMPVGVEQR